MPRSIAEPRHRSRHISQIDEYLGRVDAQVKLRGFRVELGEIESRMREFAGIRDGVVALREGPDGQKELVAYMVERRS